VGTFSVADNRTKLDPRGYLAGEKRNYNLRGFDTANHAAAVARVGPAGESHADLIVEKCVTAVVPVSGDVAVGINDGDLGNNIGKISFHVETGLPELDEWKSGFPKRCDGPSR
jgi:hypothetical protein